MKPGEIIKGKGTGNGKYRRGRELKVRKVNQNGAWKKDVAGRWDGLREGPPNPRYQPPNICKQTSKQMDRTTRRFHEFKTRGMGKMAKKRNIVKVQGQERSPKGGLGGGRPSTNTFNVRRDRRVEGARQNRGCSEEKKRKTTHHEA